MRGIATSNDIVKAIQLLRAKGQSISEISKAVNKSKSIVSRYIQGVQIKSEYKGVLRVKQGGSRMRAEQKWQDKRAEAKNLIKELSREQKLLILASLYWGEGTKSELNIINSDSSMLRVVVHCLKDLGVKDNDFRATIRIFSDIEKNSAVDYWSAALSIPKTCFLNVNVIRGRKEGKLPFGMCRLRVRSGANYFKTIISVIGRIKELLP